MSVWSKINSEDMESLKQIRFFQYLLNELLHGEFKQNAVNNYLTSTDNLFMESRAQ